MKYYFTLIGGDYRSSKNKLEEAAKVTDLFVRIN